MPDPEVLGFAVLLLLIMVGALIYCHRHPAAELGPALDERPAPFVEPPALRAAPALRVHLCTVCVKIHVPRPGELCASCLRDLNPVPRAEEIAREAAR